MTHVVFTGSTPKAPSPFRNLGAGLSGIAGALEKQEEKKRLEEESRKKEEQSIHPSPS